MPVLECCQQYRGRARVRLHDIALHPYKKLSLTREKVQRLVEIFEGTGCKNLDPEHRLVVKLSATHLQDALDQQGLTPDCIRGPGNEKTLTFAPGQLVCLAGQARVKAGKQYLSDSEALWIADLLLDSIPTHLEEQLIASNLHEAPSREGLRTLELETYENWRRRSLRNELTPTQNRNLATLQRCHTLCPALQKVLRMPGQRALLALCNFKKYHAVHCPEPIANYLTYIYEFYLWLLDGRENLLEQIDAITIQKIDGRAPAMDEDHRILEDAFKSGDDQIFATFSDEDRERVQEKLFSFRAIIPSIRTFQKDIQHFLRWARTMKDFVERKQKTNCELSFTVQKVLEDSFRDEDPAEGWFQIQISESEWRSCRASKAQRQEWSYCQMWLCAIRNSLSNISNNEHAREQFGSSSVRLWAAAQRLGYEMAPVHHDGRADEYSHIVTRSERLSYKNDDDTLTLNCYTGEWEVARRSLFLHDIFDVAGSIERPALFVLKNIYHSFFSQTPIHLRGSSVESSLDPGPSCGNVSTLEGGDDIANNAESRGAAFLRSDLYPSEAGPWPSPRWTSAFFEGDISIRDFEHPSGDAPEVRPGDPPERSPEELSSSGFVDHAGRTNPSDGSWDYNIQRPSQARVSNEEQPDGINSQARTMAAFVRIFLNYLATSSVSEQHSHHRTSSPDPLSILEPSHDFALTEPNSVPCDDIESMGQYLAVSQEEQTQSCMQDLTQSPAAGGPPIDLPTDPPSQWVLMRADETWQSSVSSDVHLADARHVPSSRSLSGGLDLRSSTLSPERLSMLDCTTNALLPPKYLHRPDDNTGWTQDALYSQTGVVGLNAPDQELPLIRSATDLTQACQQPAGEICMTNLPNELERWDVRAPIQERSGGEPLSPQESPAQPIIVPTLSLVTADTMSELSSPRDPHNADNEDQGRWTRDMLHLERGRMLVDCGQGFAAPCARSDPDVNLNAGNVSSQAWLCPEQEATNSPPVIPHRKAISHLCGQGRPQSPLSRREQDGHGSDRTDSWTPVETQTPLTRTQFQDPSVERLAPTTSTREARSQVLALEQRYYDSVAMFGKFQADREAAGMVVDTQSSLAQPPSQLRCTLRAETATSNYADRTGIHSEPISQTFRLEGGLIDPRNKDASAPFDGGPKSNEIGSSQEGIPRWDEPLTKAQHGADNCGERLPNSLLTNPNTPGAIDAVRNSPSSRNSHNIRPSDRDEWLQEAEAMHLDDPPGEVLSKQPEPCPSPECQPPGQSVRTTAVEGEFSSQEDAIELDGLYYGSSSIHQTLGPTQSCQPPDGDVYMADLDVDDVLISGHPSRFPLQIQDCFGTGPQPTEAAPSDAANDLVIQGFLSEPSSPTDPYNPDNNLRILTVGQYSSEQDILPDTCHPKISIPGVYSDSRVNVSKDNWDLQARSSPKRRFIAFSTSALQQNWKRVRGSQTRSQAPRPGHEQESPESGAELFSYKTLANTLELQLRVAIEARAYNTDAHGLRTQMMVTEQACYKSVVIPSRSPTGDEASGMAVCTPRGSTGPIESQLQSKCPMDVPARSKGDNTRDTAFFSKPLLPDLSIDNACRSSRNDEILSDDDRLMLPEALFRQGSNNSVQNKQTLPRDQHGADECVQLYQSTALSIGPAVVEIEVAPHHPSEVPLQIQDPFGDRSPHAQASPTGSIAASPQLAIQGVKVNARNEYLHTNLHPDQHDIDYSPVRLQRTATCGIISQENTSAFPPSDDDKPMSSRVRLSLNTTDPQIGSMGLSVIEDSTLLPKAWRALHQQNGTRDLLDFEDPDKLEELEQPGRLGGIKAPENPEDSEEPRELGGPGKLELQVPQHHSRETSLVKMTPITSNRTDRVQKSAAVTDVAARLRRRAQLLHYNLLRNRDRTKRQTQQSAKNVSEHSCPPQKEGNVASSEHREDPCLPGNEAENQAPSVLNVPLSQFPVVDLIESRFSSQTKSDQVPLENTVSKAFVKRKREPEEPDSYKIPITYALRGLKRQKARPGRSGGRVEIESGPPQPIAPDDDQRYANQTQAEAVLPSVERVVEYASEQIPDALEIFPPPNDQNRSDFRTDDVETQTGDAPSEPPSQVSRDAGNLQFLSLVRTAEPTTKDPEPHFLNIKDQTGYFTEPEYGHQARSQGGEATPEQCAAIPRLSSPQHVQIIPTSSQFPTQAKTAQHTMTETKSQSHTGKRKLEPAGYESQLSRFIPRPRESATNSSQLVVASSSQLATGVAFSTVNVTAALPPSIQQWPLPVSLGKIPIPGQKHEAEKGPSGPYFILVFLDGDFADEGKRNIVLIRPQHVEQKLRVIEEEPRCPTHYYDSQLRPTSKAAVVKEANFGIGAQTYIISKSDVSSTEENITLIEKLVSEVHRGGIAVKRVVDGNGQYKKLKVDL